jgi:hypothetical protein
MQQVKVVTSECYGQYLPPPVKHLYILTINIFKKNYILDGIYNQ